MNTPATVQGAPGSRQTAAEPTPRMAQDPPADSGPATSPTGPRSEPGHMATPLEILARNPRSLRAAINAKCWDCVGQDADPAPRRRIGECGCTSCPLHAVRPYQREA